MKRKYLVVGIILCLLELSVLKGTIPCLCLRASDTDISSSSNISDPAVEWDRVIEGITLTNGESLFQNENTMLITGQKAYDTALLQIDEYGNVIWKKTYGGFLGEAGYCIRQTSDRGYIITGIAESYFDMMSFSKVGLWRVDFQGNLLWNKSLKFGREAAGRSILQTEDNGFICLGYCSMNSFDVLVLKTDAEGNIQWNRTYGGPDQEIGMSIDTRPDGGYFILAWTESFGTGLWLLEIDENGSELRNQTIPENGWGSAMTHTSDGGHIVTGHYDRFYQGKWNQDAWLLKLDETGEIEWNKTYGGKLNEFGNSVHETTDGGYIVTGGTSEYVSSDPYILWILRTDANGLELWNRSIIAEDSAHGSAITMTSDGMIFIAGELEKDLWILKLADGPSQIIGKTLVIGKITNLEKEGVFITFQGDNVILFRLNPFQIRHYSNSEYITISSIYNGIVRPRFIFCIS